MPQASPQAAAQVRYWLINQDTAYIEAIPPIINQWYTVLEADDLRLKIFALSFVNDEQATPNWEIKWTLDGNIYLFHYDPESDGQMYVSMKKYSIANGVSLWDSSSPLPISNKFFDMCCLHGKLEIRLTNALGTNPILKAWCVYETLEVT
jgi:hypothetical protein